MGLVGYVATGNYVSRFKKIQGMHDESNLIK